MDAGEDRGERAVEPRPEDPVGHPVAPVAGSAMVEPVAGRAGGGPLPSLVIAGVAVAVVVGGWFLLTARTSDAGSAREPAVVAALPTDAPPSISELAAQGGAVDAADQFAAGPVAPIQESPDPESPVAESPVAESPVAGPALTQPAAPETLAPSTTEPAVAAPAPAPPTTVPEPTIAAGPRVEIVPRTEPCKFGASCLVAGFVLHDFEWPPSEFVCEFGSGQRFTFSAGGPVVERACATGSHGDSITIEVAGVRSDTVTHG